MDFNSRGTTQTFSQRLPGGQLFSIFFIIAFRRVAGRAGKVAENGLAKEPNCYIKAPPRANAPSFVTAWKAGGMPFS